MITTADMLNAPGRYKPAELRAAAAEMENFLLQFLEIEKVLGKGAINEGSLYSRIESFRTTADIVEARDKQ